MAEKQLLQTRLKSINNLLDNNAKQLELTRSKIVSILPAPSYQQCQEFIEKIKETRFTRVRERQVRKFNNLINKKEGSVTWQRSQVFPATRASPWTNNRQVTLATRALQAANNSQAGITPRASPQASQADIALTPVESTITQASNSQASPVDSTLPQTESAISQAGTPQAGNSQSSLADSTLPQAERAISWAGNPQASPADSTLCQVESAIPQAGNSQASPADSTLPQAESAISQASPVDNTLSQPESAVLPQAFPAVRHSARHRASQASPNNNSQVGNTPNNSSSQAGNTPRADSTISQSDSEVSQVASSQASASQEARSSPLPNRHNSPQGPSSLEEPNPKRVINLSSKPLTKAQRSILAKGPTFVVSPKHPPNLEYITAIEAACTKLSQQDAGELRANINWVLRASHPPNLI